MDEQKNDRSQPQKQTASNPSGIENPFENKQSASLDVEQAEEELEKEQQFKEAQTERD